MSFPSAMIIRLAKCPLSSMLANPSCETMPITQCKLIPEYVTI